MMNLNEIDITKYHRYFLTKSEPGFSLYIDTPEGMVDFVDYDLFQTNNGILIAFHKVDFESHLAFTLVNGDYREIIQAPSYEFVQDYLNNDVEMKNVYYIVCNSVPYDRNAGFLTESYTEFPEERRCNTTEWNPIGFKPSDGVAENIYDPKICTYDNVTSTPGLLNIPRYFHIFRIIYKTDLPESFRNWPFVTMISNTFLGAFKLATEWANLANEPFNSNEPAAVKCKLGFEALKTPKEIFTSIENSQIDMSPYRFIKNEEDSRGYRQENTIFPDDVKSWIKTQYRYETLSSLIKHNPNKFIINDSILEQERKNLESVIVGYCDFFGIDYENKEFKEIYEIMMLSENQIKIIELKQIRNTLRQYKAII